MKTLIIVAAAFFAYEYYKKHGGASPCSGCAGSGAGCAGCSAGAAAAGGGAQVIPIDSIGSATSATGTPAGSGQMTIAQHTPAVVISSGQPVSNVRYPVSPTARLPIALRAPTVVINAYQAAAIAQAFAY